MSTALLDRVVWAHVERILTNPELMAAELERTQSSDPTADDLAAVERQLTGVVREQRAYIENLGKVTGAAATLIAEKVNALEAQREQLTVEREAILSRAQAWQDAQDRLGKFEAWCQTWTTNLKTLTYQEKRLALDALGVEVRLWHASHEPRYDIRASIPLDGIAARQTERRKWTSSWTDSASCWSAPSPSSKSEANACDMVTTTY